MPAVIQDGVNQSRMIENGIARFDVAQKIDKRDLIGLGARERAHDEVEIGGGKPRRTIRPDHRELIMREGGAYGKPETDIETKCRKPDRCPLGQINTDFHGSHRFELSGSLQ